MRLTRRGIVTLTLAALALILLANHLWAAGVPSDCP